MLSTLHAFALMAFSSARGRLVTITWLDVNMALMDDVLIATTLHLSSKHLSLTKKKS